jgi:hypothetical protein
MKKIHEDMSFFYKHKRKRKNMIDHLYLTQK